jgi:hypothetical protein
MFIAKKQLQFLFKISYLSFRKKWKMFAKQKLSNFSRMQNFFLQGIFTQKRQMFDTWILFLPGLFWEGRQACSAPVRLFAEIKQIERMCRGILRIFLKSINTSFLCLARFMSGPGFMLQCFVENSWVSHVQIYGLRARTKENT